MIGLSVVPGRADATAIQDMPEPQAGPGEILVRTLAVGVCGTDREILRGEYGVAPQGCERLIIGHEALVQVVSAVDTELSPGDLVVPFVRRPDPVPCAACAIGEWDMCRNGLYTEHGIKERDGFCRERFALDAQACVRLDPRLRQTGVLLEPTSVVAKAWDHIERIGARTRSWRAATVLITGAGPIGLLAALLASQRKCDIHIYDRESEGVKPQLASALGATYHYTSIESACAVQPDVIVECTGAADVIVAVLSRNAPAGIVCLAGLSSGAHRIALDMNALNRSLVLENDVVFGSVNANRHHYELAAQALAAADPSWLQSLITRRVPLHRWQEAFERRAGDVKVVIDLDAAQ